MADKNLRLQLKLNPEEYMKDRVSFKIKVYTSLGDRHRWLYYSTSIISIVCAATVPVLIKSTGYLVHATVLSLVVTILVSLEKLFLFRQHWRNYDSIDSYLRREQLYFQTRAGDYKGKGDEDAFDLFVKRIEEGIKSEREETIEMRTREVTK
ncbi:MAG: DUF4231 domain-containing protein [Pyrinomonadaceae bacterium]|nr:DUF4231 domain-containing protein [Pyrinomonadaceae bacterium]